jgi:hypothetical protein
MFLSLLFWLVMLLPGYAVLRRVQTDSPACGLLGAIGLAYLWVFALLSPISILCYVLELPAGVFSTACVLAIVGGVLDIHRRGLWRELGRLVAGAVGIELLLVVADLVGGGLAGGFLAGDTEIHASRIRFLLDHGFSNASPFVDASSFFALYHTNLHHALYVACCQLSGADYLTVWYISIVWAKLAIAGGCFYLSWTVLRERWAAWLATLFLVVSFSPTPFLMYPNKLAPLWLIPIGMGLVVEICRGSGGMRAVIGLAATGWVLAQVHGLYAIFLGMVALPVWVVFFAIPRLRQGMTPTGGAGRLAATGLLALVIGAPFVLIARYGGERPPPAAAELEKPKTPDEQEKSSAFHEWNNGLIAMRLDKFMGGQGRYRIPLMLVGGATLLVLNRGRREVGALMGMAGVALAVLFVPWLCTGFADLLGARWVLGRIGPTFGLAFAVLTAGALGVLLAPRLPRWWMRAPLSLAVAGLAIGLVYSRGEHSWEAYQRKFRNPSEEGLKWLRALQARRELLREHVPAGSTVLAHPRDGRHMTLLHDCYIVMPDRGAGVGPTLRERRGDLNIMLSARTPWPQRRELLVKYDIDRLVTTAHYVRFFQWAREHKRGEFVGTGMGVVVLQR